MVRSRAEGKRGIEELDADADISDAPARVLGQGRDTSACGDVEAPRLVDPVLEFQFEDLCPLVVGWTGGAVAVSRQEQRQVTGGLRFSRDDAVVEVQQGPESG
jgi:hypothetical protein